MSLLDIDDDDDDQSVVETEVANGWKLRTDAIPSTLSASERSQFAIVPDTTYRPIDLTSQTWQGIIRGGEAWTTIIDDDDDDDDECGSTPSSTPIHSIDTTTNTEIIRSPWAVWATTPLLSPTECDEWIQRGEELQLETGDFIFAGTAKFGHSRLHTGARRYSATRMVEDPVFASILTDRLQGQVPDTLNDGRRYGGVGGSFLVSRYVPDQYFAPHFDGRGSGVNTAQACSEFTVVVYLTTDFVGGATHYLRGPGSEVQQNVAVRPERGCASVHRQGTVLHAGGAVVSGTKYIMQCFLYYEAPKIPEPRLMTNLRWGV
eukprot:CAMPEP_0170911662 /NCGR_PEP_ID=MMETSP0735-20130129/3816_1 /TAXON_ID=186038 /ORGANISM="Fragilariopsis kerguelensis, Strain L26-C5" /LENGTH=317 /DNA_ID=CAMNT_0011308583 /DNA_START=43 /DNA_END=996 /DNA_ORIENTATION=+